MNTKRAQDWVDRGDTDDPRLLRLAPRDNVSVVKRPVASGESLRVGGVVVVASRELPIGFKVANRAIAAGERVFKYGVPIGTATEPVAPGELVHLHNLKSDYLPTYMLDDANPFAKGE